MQSCISLEEHSSSALALAFNSPKEENTQWNLKHLWDFIHWSGLRDWCLQRVMKAKGTWMWDGHCEKFCTFHTLQQTVAWLNPVLGKWALCNTSLHTYLLNVPSLTCCTVFVYWQHLPYLKKSHFLGYLLFFGVFLMKWENKGIVGNLKWRKTRDWLTDPWQKGKERCPYSKASFNPRWQ